MNNIPTLVITENPFRENINLPYEGKNITSKALNWDFIFNIAKENGDLNIEFKSPNQRGKLTSYMCDTYYKFIDFILFGYDIYGVIRLSKGENSKIKINYIPLD